MSKSLDSTSRQSPQPGPVPPASPLATVAKFQIVAVEMPCLVRADHQHGGRTGSARIVVRIDMDVAAAWRMVDHPHEPLADRVGRRREHRNHLLSRSDAPRLPEHRRKRRNGHNVRRLGHAGKSFRPAAPSPHSPSPWSSSKAVSPSLAHASTTPRRSHRVHASHTAPVSRAQRHHSRSHAGSRRSRQVRQWPVALPSRLPRSTTGPNGPKAAIPGYRHPAHPRN